MGAQPIVPVFHFQCPFSKELAGIAPAWLGDEIRIQIFAEVLQVLGRPDAFAHCIQPEIRVGEGPQVIDIADNFQAGGDGAGGGQLLRPVMEKDGLVDIVFLTGGQGRLERISFQDLLRDLLTKYGMPGFGLDGVPGKAEPHNTEAFGNLELAHLAPAGVVQHKGDLNDALINRPALGLAEFFYEGQAGGHMDIRAAGMQVRQHHLEEIPIGWFHQLQVLVMPGEVDQVVQIRGIQGGILREAQFDVSGDPGGLARGEAELGK